MLWRRLPFFFISSLNQFAWLRSQKIFSINYQFWLSESIMQIQPMEESFVFMQSQDDDDDDYDDGQVVDDAAGGGCYHNK